jgi:hypothetical protein
VPHRLLLPIIASVAVVFSSTPAGAQSDSLEVWMRAFIPNPANAGAAHDFIVPVQSGAGSLVRLLNSDKSPANLCFATDHRGMSQDATQSSRLETRFTIKRANAVVSVEPASGRTTAAVTRQVDCGTGKVLKEAPGKVERDHLGSPAVADGVIQVIGQAEGRNLLTPLGSLGPAIDYSFDLQWKPAAKQLVARFTYGSFPAFEVYARRAGGAWVNVLRRAPTGTPWALGGDGFGVNTESETVTVSVP